MTPKSGLFDHCDTPPQHTARFLGPETIERGEVQHSTAAQALKGGCDVTKATVPCNKNLRTRSAKYSQFFDAEVECLLKTWSDENLKRQMNKTL